MASVGQKKSYVQGSSPTRILLQQHGMRCMQQYIACSVTRPTS